MTTKLERAGVVAQLVQLLHVDLVRVEVTGHVDPLQSASPSEPESLVLGFHCDYEERSTETGDRFILVSVECQVEGGDSESGCADGEEVGNALFTVRAEYRLTYRVVGTEALPPDALHCFAWLNGPYNAWPYWREFVQSMSARMGLPGVVLPVFRPSGDVVPDPPGSAGSEDLGTGARTTDEALSPKRQRRAHRRSAK